MKALVSAMSGLFSDTEGLKEVKTRTFLTQAGEPHTLVTLEFNDPKFNQTLSLSAEEVDSLGTESELQLQLNDAVGQIDEMVKQAKATAEAMKKKTPAKKAQAKKKAPAKKATPKKDPAPTAKQKALTSGGSRVAGETPKEEPKVETKELNQTSLESLLEGVS